MIPVLSFLLLVSVSHAAEPLELIERERTFVEDVFQFLLDDETAFEKHLEEEQGNELFPTTEAELATLQKEIDSQKEGAFVQIIVEGNPVEMIDVPGDAWFAPYIRSAAARGVLVGYRDEEGDVTGLFGPGNSVTIEELAKIALKTAGLDETSCGSEVKNPAAKGRWSENFIRCAESRGFSMYSDGSVDPARPATRAEVVVTMLQAWEITASPIPDGERVFKDVFASLQFASFIERAAKDGIVSGTTDSEGNPTGLFLPDAPVTRAETAKIATLVYDAYSQ